MAGRGRGSRGTGRSTRGAGRSRARAHRTSNASTSNTPAPNLPQGNPNNAAEASRSLSTDPLKSPAPKSSQELANTGESTNQGPAQNSADIPVSNPPDSTKDNSKLPELNPSSNDNQTPTLASAPANAESLPLPLAEGNRPFIHNEGPFAAPEGMHGWTIEDLNDILPGMDGFLQPMDRLADQVPPPPPELYDDLYNRVFGANNNNQNPDPVIGDDAATRLQELAAAVLAAPPAGYLAPRSTYEPQLINPDPPPQQPSHDPFPEVLGWATNITPPPPSQQPPPLCTAPTCPLSPVPHHVGPYKHNNTPSPRPLPIFGSSNPPPQIWQALQNGMHFRGTQADADLISRFIANHVIDGNFLLAPHTNFLWGREESVFPATAVPGAPVINLPERVMPLRIGFDCSPNIDPLDPANDGTAAAQGFPPIPTAMGPPPITLNAFRRCTDTTCPILEEHAVGLYRHDGLGPRIRAAVFGNANPPPYIWGAWERVVRAEAYGLRAGNGDRWKVSGFGRLHSDVREGVEGCSGLDLWGFTGQKVWGLRFS